jgi:hypothetical protein
MVAVEIEFIGSDEGSDCTWLCLSCLREAVKVGVLAELALNDDPSLDPGTK